jgi:hypothetical protein
MPDATHDEQLIAGPDLSQALADARGDLAVLRKHAATVPIERVAQLVEGVAEAAYPFITFISESEAVIRSDHRAPWFRQRFADWARQGYARTNPRRPSERQYLLAIVPLRHDVEAVRADARNTAREELSA